MNDPGLLLFALLLASGVGSTLVWAFWTAPWIRNAGRKTASFTYWMLGVEIWVDVHRATRVAKERGHYPWPLKLQLALVGLMVVAALGILVSGLM